VKPLDSSALNESISSISLSDNSIFFTVIF
jgi:hypothetical protein